MPLLGPTRLLISEKTSYSKALRCTFFGELKTTCSSKSCIIRSVVCNTVFKNKKIVLLKVSALQLSVRVSQVYTMCKNVQKHAKTCKNVQKRAKMCTSSTYLSKNVHLKVSFTKKTCKIVQKRASEMFLDPFQKRALSRSVHLEAVYLEASLQHQKFLSTLSYDCKTAQVFSF